jgi:hypothetical protein
MSRTIVRVIQCRRSPIHSKNYVQLFMKPLLTVLIVATFLSLTSCRAGKGCPSNGRNVGAEKLLSGDAKAIKAAKKARKFRA